MLSEAFQLEFKVKSTFLKHHKTENDKQMCYIIRIIIGVVIINIGDVA